MSFPEKNYERLGSLHNAWGVAQEDIFYAVENGLLKTSIWLPLRYVERGTIKNRKFIYETHEHLEGFVGVRPEDTRQVFSHGRAKLRMFFSTCNERHMLRLAYEPPQPSISVRIGDLLVLSKDRQQFEATYQLLSAKQKNKKQEQNGLRMSEDYRYAALGDFEFHLGDVQARVLEILHDAASSRSPWVHGKTLLYESGSNAMRLRDIFRHKKNWRNLIISNERGYYRLNVSLEQLDYKPPDTVIECKQATG